mgnify:CR=1 FL=1
MSPFAYPAVLLIKAYRKFISPLFPPSCKYYPTCSSYSLEAYRKHGFIKGTALTMWRIVRCNPWSLGGIDYVPDKVRIDYFKIKRS